LNILRKHWLAFLIIVIAILWWRIFDLFTPPNSEWSPTLINIDYWSVVNDSSEQPFAIFGFFGIAIVAGLLTFWYIVPFWNVIRRLALLIVVFCVCILSTCTSNSPRIESNRRINHLMSVNYQGNVYHLAVYQSVAFMGPMSILYYVFQCDASGNKCSKIYEEAGGQLFSSKLVVSENKLIYQSSTNSHQLLPALK
jgi:hypothetical protein